MQITTVHTLPVERAKLFDALLNPDLIQKCIDGCDRLQPAGEDSYTTNLSLTVAGFRANAAGKVSITDKNPPESFTMTIEGRGAPGFVKSTSRISLNERGDQTEILCEAEAEVGGLVASVGPTLIQATVKRMMEDFFKKMSAQVAA
jgi:carbon monoxide dehydrogenase subunit G